MLKIFGKLRTLGEFWKTNFELLAGNFKEMLEIRRKFLRKFGLTLQKYFEFFMKSIKISKNCWKNFGVNVNLIWENYEETSE